MAKELSDVVFRVGKTLHDVIHLDNVKESLRCVAAAIHKTVSSGALDLNKDDDVEFLCADAGNHFLDHHDLPIVVFWQTLDDTIVLHLDIFLKYPNVPFHHRLGEAH